MEDVFFYRYHVIRYVFTVPVYDFIILVSNFFDRIIQEDLSKMSNLNRTLRNS